jgi:curli biogenesis system outer membrane secretion channel CsgG
MIKIVKLCTLIFLLASCATRDPFISAKQNEENISISQQQIAQKKINSSIDSKRFKRKIAVGRFTNETQYGRAFLQDEDLDPLGKQTSDILVSKLIESDNYIVLERQDLSKIEKEQKISGLSNELVGAETLILGSVTEFGRSTTGKKGFLSSTKIQTARAVVELRLVDVKTGHAFFSVSGSGKAQTESGEIFGFGSKAKYDATLNDKAISAAISSVINELIQKLEEKPWKTEILSKNGKNIYIAGGKYQGIKKGDILSIKKPGKTIKSNQTGFNIDLPAREIAKIKINSLFGNSETNEGSIGKIISGSISKYNIKNLIVTQSE